MYKRRRSAHAGQPCDSSCYTDQRVEVGMGAQGNAPMCRGLGCVPGRMSRRRRTQLASYPSIARSGKTFPDGSSYPGTNQIMPVPIVVNPPPPNLAESRPYLASYPEKTQIMPAEKVASPPPPNLAESRASQASRMQRRRASVVGHYRSVPNSPHGKFWSRGDNPGESYIVTSGEHADIDVAGYERG